MRGRRLLGPFLVLAMLAAACTSSSDSNPRPSLVLPQPGDSATTTTTTTPPPTTDAPLVTPPPVTGPVNRLVVIDAMQRIVTMAPDGSDVVELAPPAGTAAVYWQPQWGPGSARIVWGQASAAGFSLVSTDGVGGSRTDAQVATLPYYFYWSPDGSTLAVLHDDPRGGVALEWVEPDRGTATPLATGVPFYFSWNPDGSNMVYHVGANEFGLIDDGGVPAPLGETAREYQAPHWTNAGIFHLGSDGMRLDDGRGGSEVIAVVPGPVTFAANADGSRIAIQPIVSEAVGATASRQTVPTILPNVVSILDTTTGEVEVVTTEVSLVLFWSPDGSSLLLAAPTEEGDGGLEWMLYRDGETRSLGSFRPEISFQQTVLPFFDQYARSLRIWSPDSASFAFAGDVDGISGVWVQSAAGGAPELVSDGTWVAWSYD